MKTIPLVLALIWLSSPALAQVHSGVQSEAQSEAQSEVQSQTQRGFNGLDERYVFDNLESVERFRNWHISGWNVIDQRSLIVHTSPSRAFLLILDRHVHELPYVESIALSSTVSSVHARFDTVRALSRSGITIPARILKIYRLDSKEQRQMVRNQIRGRPDSDDAV